MAGLYIHIPYCEKLCSYCDFHFSVSVKDKEQMIQAIAKEIQIRAEELTSPINTLYFGGGTPSFCTLTELQHISDTLHTVADFSNLKEFTLEANPEDLTIEYLMGLKELGVNRLSIGIQSFNDKVLTYFNRRHDSQKAVEAVRNAQKCGFKNISIDLIYGADGFSDKTWQESVQTALTLGVQHISAYHLTIDKGSVLWHKLQKGEASRIDESHSTSQFKYLHHALKERGYSHYEVSNFALEGYESMHNSAYWQGVSYMGFGPSAHSFDGNQRSWNISNNRRYIESIESSTAPCEIEELSEIDKYNEYIMLSLRTAKGVNSLHLKNRFSDRLYSHFCLAAKRSKIIEQKEGIYYINPLDFLLSDMAITDLIYTE